MTGVDNWNTLLPRYVAFSQSSPTSQVYLCHVKKWRAARETLEKCYVSNGDSEKNKNEFCLRAMNSRSSFCYLTFILLKKMHKIKRFISRNLRIQRMPESENIVLRQLDRWRKSRKQHIFSNSRGRTFLSSFIV